MNIPFKGRELFTFDWPANNRTHSHISAHRSAQIMTRKMCYVLNLFRDFTRIEQGSWINTKQPKKKNKIMFKWKTMGQHEKGRCLLCCAVHGTVNILFFIFAKRRCRIFGVTKQKLCSSFEELCTSKSMSQKDKKKETFFFCLQWKIKDSWKKLYEQLHWNMKGKSRSTFEFMPFSHYR